VSGLIAAAKRRAGFWQQWTRRETNDNSFDYRTLTSVNGQYRVYELRCRFGPCKGAKALPVVYIAQELDGTCWEIISAHRKARPAMKVCERAARNGTGR